ncbi:MAG: hydantoinase B/oxoprolinase family protein [Firmicutes bacterium]|nr:hydantoinase B/oxoprolinase family protein [Bacillota bacterium]
METQRLGKPDQLGQLDKVEYEIFSHRLFNIVEEGRIAMGHVSASPVVVEGGETLCAFYTPEGEGFLTGAGILLHVTGAADFVKRTLDWYRDDPGICDGDQFLWNDPYVGGQHTQDNIIVKPIFYQGDLVAWVGSFMHTHETGAIDPTGTCPRATEVFHEGIRSFGLKIMDGGRFRQDIFNTVTLNTRDPDLVGLDHKAKIAGNNVCARLFLELVDRYGLDFVKTAMRKMIDDGEKMARERLRKLPDGTWHSQLYGDSSGLEQRPFKVVCTVTKKGEEIIFDYTGTAEQNPGSLNAALPATKGRLFCVLMSQLFWGLPWNEGTVRPMRLIAPEGTVVNARFPAAVSNAAIGMGGLLGEVAHECIAKMLHAAGGEFLEDAVSSYSGSAQHAYWYGINQAGKRFVGTVLDTFSRGFGATPFRDGVDTGGNVIAPAGSIADVEMFELKYPIMYLFRQHARDSGGPGRFRGGVGGEAAYMMFGGRNVTMGAYGCGLQTAVSYGLFGGYPAPPSRTFAVMASLLKERMAGGWVPASAEELASMGGSKKELAANQPEFAVGDYDVVFNKWLGGGGYGDPLTRDPEAVARDLQDRAVSRQAAEGVYGVVLDAEGHPDLAATARRREEIRAERLRLGRIWENAGTELP